MEQKKTMQHGNLKIEVPNREEIIHYSNFAIVSHSPEELVVDFARMLPGKEEATIVTRVIMTPKNAKMFLRALENNIQNFEKKFGEINVAQKHLDPLTEIQ